MEFKYCAIVTSVVLAGVLHVGAHAQGTFPGTGAKDQWLKANGFFAQGNQLTQAKKFNDAVTKYQQAIATYPDDYHYHFNLGLAQKKSGDLKGAVESFKQSLTLKRDEWKSWKALGNTLYALGRYAEAKDAFKNALAANPPANQVSELQKGFSFCSAQTK